MKIFLRIAFLAVVVILMPHHAQAALGEHADPDSSFRKSFKATRILTERHLNYTVQELQSETMTLRKYVSDGGIVFGMTWEGLTHPDLTPLLGRYAPEHKQALHKAGRQPGRRYLKLETENIVVEKWGHIRKQRGKAYAPHLIPEGVDIDDIK